MREKTITIISKILLIIGMFVLIGTAGMSDLNLIGLNIILIRLVTGFLLIIASYWVDRLGGYYDV